MSNVATMTDSLANRIQGAPIVNDMVLSVGTVNGSGSQTSNNTLMRAIFNMGVPVCAKNMFPSNIQGLPTWFTIRASEEGWLGRRRSADVTICMNADTAEDDTRQARPGSVLIYDDALGLEKLRSDLIFYPVPFRKLVAECCENVKLRKMVVNIIYVGICSELFGIEMEEIERALSRELHGKQKAIDLNLPALKAGANYAREHFKKLDRYRIQRSNKTEGKIIINGNQASAIGALYGGCTVLSWYPITPSSSLCEELIELFNEFRIDPKTGAKTSAAIQAEDEIASIGMAVGAGWAGARAMTATSGPGISLMAEIVGFAYFAEIPCVIGDVGRTGPSTGLPTRTMQSDVLFMYYCSHGDTRHPILIPGTVQECFEFYAQAFDLAADLQGPIFVMTDLDLGMNNWPSLPFTPPHKPLSRGKVLDEAEFRKLKDWGRYKDVDGDGVPWRTLPGAFRGGAYFTRGSGHDEYARYTEKGDAWKRAMDRLSRKHDTARTMVPKPVVRGKGNREGVLAYGTSDYAIEEVLARLGKEGRHLDYLRLRALPLQKEVHEFVAAHERVCVIEQNSLAQMTTILRSEYPEYAARFVPVLHYDGLPLDVEFVYENLKG